MERVSTIPGASQSKILLVVPHGADDINTSVLAEQCCQTAKCNAVINRGFERADHVDVMIDKADCNKVSHVIQDVVRDEFLDPIKRIKERIVNRIVAASRKTNTWPTIQTVTDRALVFYIHGAGDVVNKVAGEKVSVIVGNGGEFVRSSLSCQDWRRNLFIALARASWLGGCGEVYAADQKGNYAGRSYDNMNQFFRQHEPDPFTDTMQLEFPYHMRSTKKAAMATGYELGKILTQFVTYNKFEQTIYLKTI
jgi:hypothetical protein